MKEEDIMKKIREDSDNLQIPDSLSPENIEKMLNEHVANKTDDNSKVTQFPARKKLAIAIAACFGLIIAGSGAIGLINRNQNSETTAVYEEAAEATGNDALKEEAASAEAADETADYEDNADDSSYALSNEDDNTSLDVVEDGNLSDEEATVSENEQLENDLVASGALRKPKSYDDYYNTLYSAYQSEAKEMSNIRTAIDSDILYNAAEEAAPAADEAVAEADLSVNTTGDNSFKQTEQNNTADNASSVAGKDYSTTNTQEKTVDEGDVVKTDGEYIYTLNRHNFYYSSYDQLLPSITITKADNGKLNKVSTIELTGFDSSESDDYCFNEFYIYGNYLIVLYQYGYRPFSEQSCIEIYDITDKRSPKSIKTLYQSGSYVSSRISDGYLYTISSFVPDSYSFTNGEKGRTEYNKYIPYINDDMIAYNNIFYSRHLSSMSTSVVTSVDLSSPYRFTNTKAVSCSRGQVYVGEKAIYLYSTLPYDEIEKTEIMKINYEKGRLNIGGRAVVAGYLYDTFALSEYNGHLRIVSTIPANNFSWFDKKVWTDSSEQKNGFRINEDINAVYILDNDMKLCGRITGLAPGERIYSARFFGDIGYFVTYRNTDPLFSVDFSNPKEPKILGALKIPGFSNYLHFYGKDTLLGIGEERDPYSQEFKGLKLSMFNISDPANVTEEDKYILKDAYYSSAQYNHKSIMIDPEKNIFGFWYETEYYDQSDDYHYDYYYSTYTYKKGKGFVETAKYKVDYDYMFDYEDIRGLYIGKYFYLVTPSSIESYKLGSTKQIDRIYLD